MSAIGNKQPLDNSMVRIWLRDKDPDANLLLQDLEFDDDEIHLARVIAVDYYNDTPPHNIRRTASSFGNRYYLMMGTCGQLMYMAANRYLRNSLPMSAGGVSVDDQAKSTQYNQSGDRMWGAYVRWVSENKASINAMQGWGSI